MDPYSRTRFLLGEDAMQKLRAARVAVFGLGGVGGYVVEALARSGVGHLVLGDHDTISQSNINRQVLALHSTIGLPKAEAYAFIPENEGYERRYYSGFIGWLDPEGATDIYVNLRCMEIRSHEIKLYAGGGILPSSEVRLEWEETEEKLKTMKNIL